MTDGVKLQHIHASGKIERRWHNLTKDQRRVLLEKFPETATEKELLKTIRKVKRCLTT